MYQKTLLFFFYHSKIILRAGPVFIKMKSKSKDHHKSKTELFLFHTFSFIKHYRPYDTTCAQFVYQFVYDTHSFYILLSQNDHRAYIKLQGSICIAYKFLKIFFPVSKTF
jgi:hypothetical protein